MTIVISVSDKHLKALFKDALVEVLEERPELIAGIVADAVEDIALTRAVQEGEETDNGSRTEVFVGMAS